MGQASLLSAAERAKAVAAIARLAADAGMKQVLRTRAQEDSTFSVEVHIHEGPLGKGRTVIVDKIVGTILCRKTWGEGPYGITQDWREIDLSKLV